MDIKDKIFNWNFTKCNAIYEKHPKADYTFYVVDYDLPKKWMKYPSILEMRNMGIVKTKYFHTKEEAKVFIELLFQEDTMEDLSKAIFLLDNITVNMRWIKLLLGKDRIIAPLGTYDHMKALEIIAEELCKITRRNARIDEEMENEIMEQLEKVKEIVKSNQNK